MPFPGTEGVYVFTSDTFPLPVGTRHEAETRALLQTFLLPETQLAFSLAKGSIPAIDETMMVSELDTWARESHEQFRSSTKVLATSGYLPSYFPVADLDRSLALLASKGEDELNRSIDRVIDLLKSTLPLNRRWRTGLGQIRDGLTVCGDP